MDLDLDFFKKRKQKKVELERPDLEDFVVVLVSRQDERGHVRSVVGAHTVNRLPRVGLT